MRYPHAIWLPGPVHKQGYSDAWHRTGKGVILHDMDGWLRVALNILDGPAKKSWTFSNPFEGPLLQHYEVEAVTWHAGDAEANRMYAGIENEGRAPQTLNKNQQDNLVGLLPWLAQEEDWPGFVRGDTLWEHNEFMATACPSGRIPWATIIQRLEATMPGEQEEAIRHAIMMDRARLGLIGRLADREDKNAIQAVVNWAAAYLNIRATVPRP